MEAMRDSVVIVGAGTMGCGISVRSILARNHTILVLHRKGDNPRPARERVWTSLNCLVENKMYTQQIQQAETLLEIMDPDTVPWDRARIVIESIREDLQEKQSLFAQLDRLVPPEVPIWSNTSGLRISQIAEKMQYPERAVTTHFWLPAYLVPLVEVVPGEKTEMETARQAIAELKQWGKSPVLVRKDCPGQLANRILQAIIREAANIVEMGLATAEDVDMAIKMGMALRFPVWGPLEHVDAVGLEICTQVQDTVLPGLSASDKAPDIMHRMLESGDTGCQAGRGFYDWEQKNLQDLEKKRDSFIANALRFMEKQEL